jgi:hypothetical protein
VVGVPTAFSGFVRQRDKKLVPNTTFGKKKLGQGGIALTNRVHDLRGKTSSFEWDMAKHVSTEDPADIDFEVKLTAEGSRLDCGVHQRDSL